MADHALAICVFHVEQLLALAFEHLVDRDAGPARHDLGDEVGGPPPRLTCAAFVFGLLDLLELGFELGDHAVGELAGPGEIALALRLFELDARRSSCSFSFCASASLPFSSCQRRVSGRLLLEIGDLLLELLQPVLLRPGRSPSSAPRARS